MRNLETYFENPFLKIEASFDNKNRFSDVFIGRTTAQNIGGKYTVMITETLVAHQAFFGQYTNVKVKEALQQQQTLIVDGIIKDFKGSVSLLNKLLAVNKVDKTPLYQAFFPNGVTEFTEGTNKGNALSHMNRILTVVTANQGVSGGAAAVTEYQDYINAWDVSRNLQIQLMGETEGGRTTRDNAEEAWADQMFKNLLTLGLEYRNQPNMLDDFFDQSIVRKKPNPEDKTFTGNVGANMSLGISVMDLVVDEETELVSENPINLPNSIYKLQFQNTENAPFDNGRPYISVLSQTPPATHTAAEAGFNEVSHYKYMVLFANDQQTAFKITVKQ